MRIVHQLSKSLLSLTCLGVIALVSATAIAAVPVTMTQQGRLIDQDGEPRTGELELLFEIYDSSTGDNLLWSDQMTVDVGDTGVYSVTLGGSDNPIDADVLQDGDAYLGLTVDGSELSPRLEMTSVPFAAIAERAAVADSVADGSITSDSLASGAVTSEVVDSIDWSQITGVPSEIQEPTDTLAELSCSSDELALFDGSNWSCAALPTYSGDDFALSDQSCDGDDVAVGVNTDGTLMCDEQRSYTAGAGLELDDSEFSVVDGQFVECLGSPCPVGESSRFYVDGDTDGSNYLEGRNETFCFPSPVGCISTQTVVSGNDMLVEGALEIDDGAIVGEELHVEDRLGINLDESPETSVHIKQDIGTRGLTLETMGASRPEAWTLGTSNATNNLHFRYSDDIHSDDPSLMAWINRDSGEFHTASDRRVKQDIQTVDQILDDVMELQPMQYRYKHRPDADATMGFMAQQVEELFPHLVSYDPKNDHYGLSYAGFSVLAVQAIREQQQVIDDLEDRLAEIERQLADH